MGRRSQSRPPSSGSKGSKFRISRADCKSPVDERFLGHHSWVLPSPLPLRIFRHPFFARIRDGDAMRSLNQPASRNRSTRQQKKVGKKWTAKNEVPRSFEKTPKPETSFQKSEISQTSIFKLSEPIFRFHLSFCNCLWNLQRPFKFQMTSSKFQIGFLRNSDFQIPNWFIRNSEFGVWNLQRLAGRPAIEPPPRSIQPVDW